MPTGGWPKQRTRGLPELDRSVDGLRLDGSHEAMLVGIKGIGTRQRRRSIELPDDPAQGLDHHRVGRTVGPEGEPALGANDQPDEWHEIAGKGGREGKGLDPGGKIVPPNVTLEEFHVFGPNDLARRVHVSMLLTRNHRTEKQTANLPKFGHGIGPAAAACYSSVSVSPLLLVAHYCNTNSVGIVLVLYSR